MAQNSDKNETFDTDLLIKNNQKIAHDLRSPLSALNFVSSMNPNLPDSSRELLAMAIQRFEEIANRLDTNTTPKN